MWRRAGFKLLSVVLLIVITAGCSDNDKVGAAQSPEQFIQANRLSVEGTYESFQVDVPQDWQIKLGDYPVGLYWELANEYSKDAGLDLTGLKGKTVQAQRYALIEGLPGEGDNSSHKYPSNLVLLVEEGKTAGAWLEFNVASIGPSVNKKILEQIAGMSYEEWVTKKALFSNAGENSDLASLQPTEVLDAFFKAVSSGNPTRARACLGPWALLQSLTANREEKQLYNPGFKELNAVSESMEKAVPLAYKLMGTGDGLQELKEVGDRRDLIVEVQLAAKWKHPGFNSADGKETRFANLQKTAAGWKLESLGTGL